MVKKSKLLFALDAHKGRDYDAEKVKKHVKATEKKKQDKQDKKKSDKTNGDVGLNAVGKKDVEGKEVAPTVQNQKQKEKQDKVCLMF